MVLAACVFTGFRYNARARWLQLVTVLLQLAVTREAIQFTQRRKNDVSSESTVQNRIAAHFGDAVVGRGGRRRHSRALQHRPFGAVIVWPLSDPGQWHNYRCQLANSRALSFGPFQFPDHGSVPYPSAPSSSPITDPCVLPKWVPAWVDTPNTPPWLPDTNPYSEWITPKV